VHRLEADQVVDDCAQRVALGMERAEMAWMLGTASEALSRSFRHLREDRLVGRSPGRVIAVLDVAALERVASL